MEDKNNFIDPTASTSSKKIKLAERPEDLSGKIIGMIDNTKEEADVILEAFVPIFRTDNSMFLTTWTCIGI